MKKFGVILTFVLFCFTLGSNNLKAQEKNDIVKIGISWDRDYEKNIIPEDTQVYIDAVKKTGAIPILLPQIRTVEDANNSLKTVDAIIMTGGEDIGPAYYNEKPMEKLETVKEDRDISDYLLLTTAIEKNYPILGTCRGMQFLNVVQGGTLYQDFPSQRATDILIQHRDPNREVFLKHECRIIDKTSELYKILKTENTIINSWHHQAVKDLGKNLKIVAVAPDGIVEAIEMTNKDFVLGVQFHPEWHVADNEKAFLSIFETLKEYAIKHQKIKK